MIFMTRNSWPHIWQTKTYQIYQTEHWNMFPLLNHRRCQITDNNVEAFTPSRCCNSRKHLIWDISLHQHVSNLLSHKDERHPTLTSSCRDYLTAVKEAGCFASHLHSVWDTNLVHARHHSSCLTSFWHKYENLNTNLSAWKKNKRRLFPPVVRCWRDRVVHWGNDPSWSWHKQFIMTTVRQR